MTYTTTTTEVTLALRDSFPIKSFGQETVYAEFAKMPPALLVELLEQGAVRILNDGNGAKDLTDADKIAKMRKRIDSWMRGQFRIVERGSTDATLMREALEARLAAAHGVSSVSAAMWKKFAVDSLKAAKMPLPKDDKLPSVDDVVAARAKLGGVDGDEYAGTLLAEGNAIAAARSAALTELDVTSIAI